MKTVEDLTWDFEWNETLSRKAKMMTGQASQRMMEEINKRIAKGVIEYTEHEKGEFILPFSFVPNLTEQED